METIWLFIHEVWMLLLEVILCVVAAPVYLFVILVKWRAKRQVVSRHLQRLFQTLRSTEDYRIWYKTARRIDKLRGFDSWQADENCEDYAVEELKARLRHLRRLRTSGDVRKMAHCLRADLHRNVAGIRSPKLYCSYMVGTKRIIEDYTSELKSICELIRDSTELSPHDKREFFECCIHSYGKTALLLSGGSMLGLHHLGVIKTLWNAQVLPRIFSGSSSGSIIGALMCSKADEEIADMLENFNVDVHAFSDMKGRFGIREGLIRLMTTGSIMDGDLFKRQMIAFYGEITFEEAYRKTGRVLNVTVSATDHTYDGIVCNYVTTPHVLVWSSVVCSCSFYGLFPPGQLMQKELDGTISVYAGEVQDRYRDGSLTMDLPVKRVQELFNVNWFIVCQTNPHAIPFIRIPEEEVWANLGLFPMTVWWQRWFWWAPGSTSRVRKLLMFVVGEVAHVLEQAMELFGIWPSVKAILNQKYTGDVTIVPLVTKTDYANMLQDPTKESLAQSSYVGQRCTWPHLNMIRFGVILEQVLDACLVDSIAQQFVHRKKRDPSSMLMVTQGLLLRHSRSIYSCKPMDEMESFKDTGGGADDDDDDDDDGDDDDEKFFSQSSTTKAIVDAIGSSFAELPTYQSPTTEDTMSSFVSSDNWMVNPGDHGFLVLPCATFAPTRVVPFSYSNSQVLAPTPSASVPVLIEVPHEPEPVETDHRLGMRPRVGLRSRPAEPEPTRGRVVGAINPPITRLPRSKGPTEDLCEASALVCSPVTMLSPSLRGEKRPPTDDSSFFFPCPFASSGQDPAEDHHGVGVDASVSPSVLAPSSDESVCTSPASPEAVVPAAVPGPMDDPVGTRPRRNSLPNSSRIHYLKSPQPVTVLIARPQHNFCASPTTLMAPLLGSIWGPSWGPACPSQQSNEGRFKVLSSAARSAISSTEELSKVHNKLEILDDEIDEHPEEVIYIPQGLTLNSRHVASCTSLASQVPSMHESDDTSADTSVFDGSGEQLDIGLVETSIDDAL